MASACLAAFGLLALILWCAPAEAQKLERLQVAPDQWTFRGAESGNPFVPFGTNYTPTWGGWPPDFVGTRWDEAAIQNDLDAMRGLGVNLLKFAVPLIRILPDPQAPGNVVPSAEVLARVDRVVAMAGERGIRLILTVEPGWRGLPRWFRDGGNWYGPGSLQVLDQFWRQIATRYRGDGRIFGYAFCVETSLSGWSSQEAQALFQQWARDRYAIIEAANTAWGTDFAGFEHVTAAGYDGNNAQNWRDLPEGAEGNENKTNDPYLYDYLLFREWAAFRYMYRQTLAVKSADPQALTGMGFVQWNPILRQLWGPVWEGPSRGPEYNAREMAKAFDYLGIHFYPIYRGGSPDVQIKYLKLWARWADAGKPVILEEFNNAPAEANAPWCERVIRETRDYVGGWLVWTFQDVPNSDSITEACGLLNVNGERTAWGRRFAEMAPEVTAWRLTRPEPHRTIPVDKRWLYTSGDYRSFLDGLLKEDDALVAFEVEPNPTIDALLQDR